MMTANGGLHSVQNSLGDFRLLGVFLCVQEGRERSYSEFSLCCILLWILLKPLTMTFCFCLFYLGSKSGCQERISSSVQVPGQIFP